MDNNYNDPTQLTKLNDPTQLTKLNDSTQLTKLNDPIQSTITNDPTQLTKLNDQSQTTKPNDPTQQNQSKPKNRCHTCNKKVGLLGFECKCGGNYCSLHRFNNDHNCTFDFKSVEIQKLKDANPKITAPKIIKI